MTDISYVTSLEGFDYFGLESEALLAEEANNFDLAKQLYEKAVYLLQDPLLSNEEYALKLQTKCKIRISQLSTNLYEAKQQNNVAQSSGRLSMPKAALLSMKNFYNGRFHTTLPSTSVHTTRSSYTTTNNNNNTDNTFSTIHINTNNNTNNNRNQITQRNNNNTTNSFKQAQRRNHVVIDNDEYDNNEEEPSTPIAKSSFMTGVDKYNLDAKTAGNRSGGIKRKHSSDIDDSRPVHNSGLKKNNSHINRKFVSPVTGADNTNVPSFVKKALDTPEQQEDDIDPRLKGCDPKLVEVISNEIMDHSPQVKWQDIAGLEFAKKSVQEIVVWPLLRPDLFQGLRGPPKGILLFGPPGTGKTLIGKAIASEANAQFFSISASSLTSKWHGEGEKLVKTLFAVARVHQPAVIFIDEIDSLLSQRTDGEYEASRRMKNEFLVNLDGASTEKNDRVLVVGATNRPQELDQAARRRLVKKLYIPLPERKARKQLMLNLLKTENHCLEDSHFDHILDLTEGYSGADMHCLCTEAAFGPMRSVVDISTLNTSNVRAIDANDFEAALKQVRPSVSPNEITQYIDWNTQYGSFPAD